MSDTHDMTEQDTVAKADAPSRVQNMSPDDKSSSNSDSNIKPPKVLTLLDPKIEHTRDAWHDLKSAANNLFLTARYHTIRALPRWMVNNSTNILGFTHVMTEMMMFKASGADAKLVKNPDKAINWIKEPLENVFKGTFDLAAIQKTNPKFMPSTGNWFRDKLNFIVDTSQATQREMDRQETNQRNDLDRKNVEDFQKKDAYKTLVEPHVDSAITKKVARKKKPLTPEEVEQVKGAIEKHAGPQWQEHETRRMAGVDQLRQKYREKLGLTEVEGHGGLAFGKEAYAESLTRELEGMNKNARALAVKKYEGELKQISGGPIYSSMRLANPWQMRSTFAGLIAWTLSAIIPDKKESDAEVERMAVLRNTNLLGYVGERFKQAVWVPQWASHKRQMIGLGIMISGICSLFGSWRNRKTLLTDAEAVVEFAGLLGKKGLLEQGATGTIDKLTKGAGHTFGKEVMGVTRYEYEFNPSYFFTSLLTFASSFPLLFASDNERGFSGFGALMTGRLAFLPTSIGKKVRDKEPGVGYYAAGMASFQAENWAQALAGGAEKKKDPKTGVDIIVDHDDERRAAHEKALAIKAQKEQQKLREKQGTPSRTVTYVSSHDMAMPERAEAHEQNTVATV